MDVLICWHCLTQKKTTMKRNLLLFSLLLTTFFANAQLSGYFKEGFEDNRFPPKGWDVISLKGSASWSRSTQLAHTGVGSAFDSYNSPKGINYLISPQFTVAASDSLSFWFATQYVGFEDSLYVQVSTTNKAPKSFTTIATFEDGGNYPLTDTTWQRVSLALASYAGQNIYVAFKHVDKNGDGIYLDDVVMGRVPADAAAVSIDVPTQLAAGKVINPQATFKNLGSQASTFNVTLTEGTYTSTKSVINLPSQNTIQVTFDALTLPNFNDTLSFTAYSSLAGDVDHSNDTVKTVSDVFVGFQNGGWISKENIPSGKFDVGTTTYTSGTSPNDTSYIYTIGGVNAATGAVSKSVYKFNTKTEQWSKGADLTVGRYTASAFTYNSKIFYIGGYHPKGQNFFLPVDNVSIYDIATDTWSEGAPMPVALGDYGAGQYKDSLIYLIGGLDGTESLSSVYIYNASADTWTTATNMPTDRYGFAAGIANNVIVLMGGSSTATGKIYSTSFKGTIDLTDPTKITWIKNDNYPAGSAFRPGGTAVKNGLKEYVYFTGGDPSGQGTEVKGNTWAYDATADSWTLGPVKTTPVSNLTQLTSLVLDDTVYVASVGGRDETGNIVAVNEWLKLGPTSQVLPIHLISFTAALQNNRTTLLNWKVAEDGTGGYYTIQRSSDGAHFTDMTDETKAGKIATTITYSGQDLLPFKGYTYYRIKIVNSDGSMSYSAVRAVNNNLAGTVTMAASVYPNPSHGVVNVLLQNNGSAAAAIGITISDIAGKKMIIDNKTIGTSVSLAYTLKPGTYIINMFSQDGSFKQSQKVIVE